MGAQIEDKITMVWEKAESIIYQRGELIDSLDVFTLTVRGQNVRPVYTMQ